MDDARDSLREGACITQAPSIGAQLGDPAAEQTFLGWLLLGAKAPDLLAPGHFIDPIHARIFEAVESYRSRGMVANLASMWAHFSRAGGLGDVGGAEYLMQICGNLDPPRGRSTDFLARKAAQAIHAAWVRRMILAELERR